MRILIFEVPSDATKEIRQAIDTLCSLAKPVESPPPTRPQATWLTPSEAARYCGMSVSTLNRRRRNGLLKASAAHSGPPRYHVNDLESFMKGKRK